MKYGLITNKLHRKHGDSGLFTWVRRTKAAMQAMNWQLYTMGGTYDALQDRGFIDSGVQPVLFQRAPFGFEGGLMRMVSRIAGGIHPDERLDGMIYLLDPVDPSSTFPEARALRRQCVIHAKPFIATVAGAEEWVEIESTHAGKSGPILVDREQTIALIAHDALKEQMVSFAATHFTLLSQFKERVATGTTGGLLNDLAWQKGWPTSKPWVTRYRSGPLGGDAQIAELVLENRCHKTIFFEDPHVARQHEADIHLLERAVASNTLTTTCFNSPLMATRWAQSTHIATDS